MFAGSVPFWWFGSNAGIEMPGGLPASALMVVVPGLVATYSVVRASGFAGARKLVQRLWPRFHAGARRWWTVSALTMPIILTIVLGIRAAEGGLSIEVLGLTPVGVALSFLIFLVAASVEELGWTAYATDVARAHRTDLHAGLVIGAYWAAWHVVPWLQAGHPASWVVAQSAFTILLRVLLVAVYRNTGRQVAAAVLLHATANLGLVPGNGTLYDPFLTTALLAPTVLLILGLAPPRGEES